MLYVSLFAVLYPTGITGEVGCMYLAAAFLIQVCYSMLLSNLLQSITDLVPSISGLFFRCVCGTSN